MTTLREMMDRLPEEYRKKIEARAKALIAEEKARRGLPLAASRPKVGAPSTTTAEVTMRLDPINLYDYEERAKLALPHDDWDTIDAGAMDMFTTRRNRTAFEELTLRPRFLRDTGERDISTTMLGNELSMPVFVCPAGSHHRAHPEGEVATARGASMSNTLMMLSTGSNCSMEEVAEEATSPLFFQLYHRGYDLTEMLVRRAEEAGFKAVCLTVDTPTPSPKERDLRNRYKRNFEQGNFRGVNRPENILRGTDESVGWNVNREAPLTWQELDWLRGLTGLPIVLKGIRTAEDAHVAAESGVDGILVSTHGGRQLDMTMGAIEMLPEIVDAVKGNCEVYVDSGVRRGSDVVKALALGAKAVGIGRPLFWGLAVNGAEGVHGVLELLREEIDRAMAYCGQTSVHDLEPNLVNIPQGWGAPPQPDF